MKKEEKKEVKLEKTKENLANVTLSVASRMSYKRVKVILKVLKLFRL